METFVCGVSLEIIDSKQRLEIMFLLLDPTKSYINLKFVAAGVIGVEGTWQEELRIN